MARSRIGRAPDVPFISATRGPCCWPAFPSIAARASNEGLRDLFSISRLNLEGFANVKMSKIDLTSHVQGSSQSLRKLKRIPIRCACEVQHAGYATCIGARCLDWYLASINVPSIAISEHHSIAKRLGLYS